MPVFDPKEMRGRDIYFLMIGTIVPRPIAFVTSMNEAGVVNLAPFSYFNGISNRPPLISISIGRRKLDGEVVKKDTLRNIEQTGEFVVNIPSEALAEQVNQSSAEYPPETSELQEVGLTAIPSDLVAPPRLAECHVAMECKLDQVVMVGKSRPVNALVIGEVVRWHVADSVWDQARKQVDIDLLRPLSRIGGSSYGRTREPFALPRPDWAIKGIKS
jgi:flavin reductase (DIM6/NTAB) family NADH-FMN oxidoreductase RutF